MSNFKSVTEMLSVIPQVGFGCYRITDKQAIVNALDHMFEKGLIPNFDVAELYKNEHLVQEALIEFRSKNPDQKVFLTTKISKKCIFDGKIEESFYKRLEIFGYIDLILLHTPSKHCREDWITLCSLYEKNRDRVGYIGVSNYDIEHLKELEGLRVPYTNQIELSPFYTRFELVKYCRDLGIVVVAHTSLTRAEKFDNVALTQMSVKYCQSKAKILLAWARQNGYVVLPRTKDLRHLHENFENDFVLSDEDIQILNNLNENFFITQVKLS